MRHRRHRHRYHRYHRHHQIRHVRHRRHRPRHRRAWAGRSSLQRTRIHTSAGFALLRLRGAHVAAQGMSIGRTLLRSSTRKCSRESFERVGCIVGAVRHPRSFHQASLEAWYAVRCARENMNSIPTWRIPAHDAANEPMTWSIAR